MADVTIIGAGPAGISAALHLHRAGRRVIVIDKAEFPRDKCCGDGLTTNALRRLEALGFDPRTLSSWAEVTDAIFCSPAGHKAHLKVDPRDGIRIGVARREELDAALVAFARAQGITIHEGHGLQSVALQGRKVRVTASGLDPIDSDYVIGADGMWSPLRRMLNKAAATSFDDSDATDAAPENPAAYLGDIHAFRQYFANVTGPAKDQLWVWFEPDLLPGYVWSFPTGDGGANVGFGIARQPGQSVAWMKTAWQDIPNRPHIRAALGQDAIAESPHKAWPIPASIKGDLLSDLDGRVLFIGDAARVVDPLTGEGIGQAIETGELVAKAIVAAGIAHPRGAARRYRNSIMLGMAIDNRFAATLARLVAHKWAATWVIRLAPHGPWKGRYAVKWAFEDNPRAALLTPWRWRQRFQTKGGAFVPSTEADSPTPISVS